MAFHEQACIVTPLFEYIPSIFVFEQFTNLDLHFSLISASFPCLYGSRVTLPAIFSSTAVT
jgi:hypothetical protein